MFNISCDSLERWVKRRQAGNLAATQSELAELWHELVSGRTISRALAKIGFTRKKRLTATANVMQ